MTIGNSFCFLGIYNFGERFYCFVIAISAFDEHYFIDFLYTSLMAPINKCVWRLRARFGVVVESIQNTINFAY